jgi:hypothetical protein
MTTNKFRFWALIDGRRQTADGRRQMADGQKIDKKNWKSRNQYFILTSFKESKNTINMIEIDNNLV